MTADVALTFGLIDAVGYAADARERLQQLLGGEVGFYTYAPPRGLAGALLGLEKPMDTPSLSLGLPPTARFLYLWQP